jgi:hypothetical protein
MIEMAFLRLAGTLMNEFTDKNEQAFLDACGAIGVKPNAMVKTQKERYLVSEFLKDPVSWLETESLYHSYTTRGEAQEVANGIDRMISEGAREQVVSSTKAFKCAMGYSVLVLTLGGYRTYGNQCETSRRLRRPSR